MRKVIFFVFLITRKTNNQFVKSLILRDYALPLISYSELLKKRFIEFLRITAFPLLFLLRLKKKETIKGLYYEMSHAPYIHNRRIKFIAKYVNNDHEENIYSFNNKAIAYQSYSGLIKNIPFLIVCWLSALLSSLLFLFAGNEKFISLYGIINGYCALRINKRKTVIFCIFASEVYTFSYLGAEFCELSISTSNSTLFPYNRYTYLPQSSIYLCSKIQIEEVKAFQKNNWFQVKKTGYWGLEEVDIYTEQYQKDINEKYDLGFYSSGEWARIDGLEREYDIENIRADKHLNNPGSVFEIATLDFLVKFCEEKQLTLCVYLHPFERELLHIHGIKPPYMDKLSDFNHVFLDAAKDSISNVYEARIGVSPFSTSIWDRFNFDKIGFIGEVKGYEFLINRQYLGLYNQFVFNTTEDLEDKLSSVI